MCRIFRARVCSRHAPLLRDHFDATLTALGALSRIKEWREIDALGRH